MKYRHPHVFVLATMAVLIWAFSQNASSSEARPTKNPPAQADESESGNNTGTTRPVPRVIALDPNTSAYQELLSGPPGTVSMHSGLVVLEPGKSVGTHNTEEYEEVIVVLEGQGEMRTTGGATLNLKAGTVGYCPPHTEHNVYNTGTTRFRYLYIAARTPELSESAQ